MNRINLGLIHYSSMAEKEIKEQEKEKSNEKTVNMNSKNIFFSTFL